MQTPRLPSSDHNVPTSVDGLHALHGADEQFLVVRSTISGEAAGPGRGWIMVRAPRLEARAIESNGRMA
jgi:hypothetical protein